MSANNKVVLFLISLVISSSIRAVSNDLLILYDNITLLKSKYPIYEPKRAPEISEEPSIKITRVRPANFPKTEQLIAHAITDKKSGLQVRETETKKYIFVPPAKKWKEGYHELGQYTADPEAIKKTYEKFSQYVPDKLLIEAINFASEHFTESPPNWFPNNWPVFSSAIASYLVKKIEKSGLARFNNIDQMLIHLIFREPSSIEYLRGKLANAS